MQGAALWSWWLADLAGGLLLAPLSICIWIQRKQKTNLNQSREALLFLCLLAIITWVIFRSIEQITIARLSTCTILLSLIWAAYRYQLRTIMLGIFIVFIIALRYIARSA